MGPVNQIASKIRSRLALRFFRRIHHYTHRVPTTVREVEANNILVFAPHPDDEVIGLGGTLAQLAQQKRKITIAWVATESSDKGNAAIRKQEAKKVAAALGADYIFMGFMDGRLSIEEDQIALEVANIIKQVNPDLIFAPFPSDHHRDHQATASSVAEGAVRARYKDSIWGYEIWSTIWPNTAVDISENIEEKKSLINMHQSQVRDVAYANAALGLNRYRGSQVFIDHAEAFFTCSVRGYRRLCKGLYKL